MPSIITHLAFVQHYLKKNGQNNIKDKGRFYAGAVFPDIRYFAQIDRDLTHLKFQPDLNFSGLSDFEAGWKSHIYLDDKWNKLFRDAGISAKYVTAVKIFQDAIEEKKIDNLPEIIEYLRKPQKSVLDIPQERMDFFYGLCANYALTKDSAAVMKYAFKQEKIERILGMVEEMSKREDIVKFLDGMLEKILH